MVINMIELERAFNAMRPVVLGWSPHWVYPSMPEWVTNGGTANTPLTSTSWDGDSYSTTAKTLIDLSAVFGVPAGVKAVMVRVAVQDSAAASGDYYITLSPNNSAGSGLTVNCIPVNDRLNRAQLNVPCNVDGDIYYQIAASGASTFDVHLQVFGYYI